MSKHRLLEVNKLGIRKLLDQLELWNEELHDAPCDDICHGTIAEDYHVAGRLTSSTEEYEGIALLFSIGEELTRTLVDSERAESAEHCTDTSDGGNG